MTQPALLPGEDPAGIWIAVSAKLQETMPRQSFLTWFTPLKAVSYDSNTLTLLIPSRFYFEWIKTHYGDDIRLAAAAVLGREIEIVYIIDPSGNHRQKPEIETPAPERGTQHDNHLNAQYRFDNFVVGDCNRFAREAAMAIASKPVQSQYNPLLIYGGSGLGKTHLMHAVGNFIVDNKLARRVLYVTAERFTKDFIAAIQTNRADSFSRLYRNVDVLLLDDVQFFLTRDKTQEEFFYTFNALHLEGRQLVFSTDRAPRELQGFDERLVSRLQWGLVTELQAPEYETRVAILRKLAESSATILPDDVVHFLATHVTDNIRNLQGALIKMLAKASLMGHQISVDLARQALRDLNKKIVQQVSVDRIQDVVASEFGIPSDLLRSKTRKKEVAQARQIAMYLATDFTHLTLKTIGLHFGGRDHATVIYARETVAEAIKADRKMAQLIQDLKAKLQLESL